MASPIRIGNTIAGNSILKARAQFPGVQDLTYLDTASRGLMPAEAKLAVDQQVDLHIRGRINKARMFELIERVRTTYSNLIKAHPDEIAFTKNVSEGLNMVASAIPWREGDNVILCPELEHPSNLYPWLHLKKRLGVEVRLLPARVGQVPVDDMIAAIDRKTRIVTCSYVTFAPGLRTDMTRLAEECVARDVMLLVDAAQGVGILDIDMDRVPISAMSVSTQKGLLALYGMGFLYVRNNWAERLHPPFLSRFSVDLGSAHEAAGGSDDYTLMPGARRFEIGNYNFLGAAAVEPGLKIITSLTTKAIEDHVLRLSERLIEGLQVLGLPLFAAQPGKHRAHMVAIGDAIGPQHDATDDPAMQSLYKTFDDNGVRLTIRRGILRVSLHLYNNEEDVDRVIDIAKSWCARPGTAIRP
jgi:cysteine desulfurase/selenocysteine lyase